MTRSLREALRDHHWEKLLMSCMLQNCAIYFFQSSLSSALKLKPNPRWTRIEPHNLLCLVSKYQSTHLNLLFSCRCHALSPLWQSFVRWSVENSCFTCTELQRNQQRFNTCGWLKRPRVTIQSYICQNKQNKRTHGNQHWTCSISTEYKQSLQTEFKFTLFCSCLCQLFDNRHKDNFLIVRRRLIWLDIYTTRLIAARVGVFKRNYENIPKNEIPTSVLTYICDFVVCNISLNRDPLQS